MFGGLQPVRSQIACVNSFLSIGVSRGSQVFRVQFLRTHTAMAAANGAAGATAKTLKMENARGLHLLKRSRLTDSSTDREERYPDWNRKKISKEMAGKQNFRLQCSDNFRDTHGLDASRRVTEEVPQTLRHFRIPIRERDSTCRAQFHSQQSRVHSWLRENGGKTSLVSLGVSLNGHAH